MYSVGSGLMSDDVFVVLASCWRPEEMSPPMTFEQF